MFLLYINDLSLGSPNCSVALFADDTNILVSGSPREMEAATAVVLQNLSGWLSRNKLLLNVKKSKAIKFLTKNKKITELPLHINNSRIDYVDSAGFLGVVIDSRVNWGPHIFHHLTKKLNSACYALRSLGGIAREEIMLQSYYASFHSVMSYGIELWGGCSFADVILRSQKRAVRIIAGKGPGHPCRQLFVNLNIMTVYSTYIFRLALFMFKHRRGVTRVNDNHSYSTRHGNEMRLERHSLALYERGSYYMGKKICNKLPSFITGSATTQQFRRRLSLFLVRSPFYNMSEFFGSAEF